MSNGDIFLYTEMPIGYMYSQRKGDKAKTTTKEDDMAKYAVISTIFDNYKANIGPVFSVPDNTRESVSEMRGRDIYLDVFDTEREAEQFRQEQVADA